MPRGLYFYDGVEWHQLSTVCGGPGRTTRIAIASTREFWTISTPSPPRNREAAGTALCRFLDGNVVGSYSTAPRRGGPVPRDDGGGLPGAERLLVRRHRRRGRRRAAARRLPPALGRRQPRDGVRAAGPRSERPRGARGVLWETVRVGKTPGDRSGQVDLFEPEPQPRLIHRIAGGAFSNDAFLPATHPRHERLSRRTAASCSRWIRTASRSGRSAEAPPRARPRSTDRCARPPLAARIEGDDLEGGGVPAASRPFTTGERFVDVAAVPGTSTAWAAVEPFGQRGSPSAPRAGRAAAARRHGRGRRPCRPAAPAAAPRRRSRSPARTRAGW